MSSHGGDDTDVNVVSSPEPSPQGCGSGSNHQSDEEVNHYHPHLSHLSHITRHSSIGGNNNSSIISNLSHHHQHLNHHHHNNNNNNNSISASNNNNNTSFLNGDSRLSPSKTPPDTPNTTPSKNGSGFTSFSISSILSRNDSANKKVNGTNISSSLAAIPVSLAAGGTLHGAQDAAMISR